MTFSVYNEMKRKDNKKFIRFVTESDYRCHSILSVELHALVRDSTVRWITVLFKPAKRESTIAIHISAKILKDENVMSARRRGLFLISLGKKVRKEKLGVN